MHRSDYTTARRLQQQIPLPIADVLALLKQHGSPQAAIAAYRAAQIAHICQAAVCSETEAAHQYDAHQGNTKRAIAAICRTLAQTEIQAKAAQMLHAADYLIYACALPDCRYIDFYGTL